MPQSESDSFIILKQKHEWPNPKEDKVSLIERIQEAVLTLPGNNYEFTQPVQMRFNELLSGVRGDVAVKVFGEDFETLLPFANQIASIMNEVTGNDGVKVEQIAGLPFINVSVDLLKAGRLGLRPAEIHHIISAAIRGQESGFILQGDRRFDIVVRYPEEFRSSLNRMKELPIPVKAEQNSFSLYDPEADLVDARPKTVPLSEVAEIKVSEGVKKLIGQIEFFGNKDIDSDDLR